MNLVGTCARLDQVRGSTSGRLDVRVQAEEVVGVVAPFDRAQAGVGRRPVSRADPFLAFVVHVGGVARSRAGRVLRLPQPRHRAMGARPRGHRSPPEALGGERREIDWRARCGRCRRASSATMDRRSAVRRRARAQTRCLGRPRLPGCRRAGYGNSRRSGRSTRCRAARTPQTPALRRDGSGFVGACAGTRASRGSGGEREGCLPPYTLRRQKVTVDRVARRAEDYPRPVVVSCLLGGWRCVRK
jgi:hypothetical protein